LVEKDKENNKEKPQKKDEIEKRKPEDTKEPQQEDLPIPQEIFDTLPEEVQVSLRTAFSMQSFSGRPPSPLLEKLTPEHIDSLIEGSREENARDYSLVSSSRWFRLAYVIIGVGLFLFVTYFFGQSNESLYVDIIKMLALFGGGFGAGFGFRAKKK